MNPDIQRIAEKWMTELVTYDLLNHEGEIKRAIDNSLTELSALRDTQERELREKVNVAERLCQIYFEIAAALIPESEVRRRRDERMEYPVFATHLLQENASLRAELARRDEVEKELRKENEISKTLLSAGAEELKDHVELLKELASLRSRIGELEAKYGVQEQLDHVFGQLPSNEDT